jgi:hypothetical protein
MKAIRGADSAVSSFTIFWTQSLILVNPTVVFSLFKEIFRLIHSISSLCLESIHTLIHSISRFVDILCYLPDRYLTDEQCSELHTFTFVAFAAPDPRVRKVTYKLSIVLDHFQTEEKMLSLVGFIGSHQSQIERYMFSLFEAFPAMSLWRKPHQHLTALDFFDVMYSNEEVIWQLMLCSFFIHAADVFTEAEMIRFRTMALNWLRHTESPQMSIRSKLFQLNVCTALAAMAQSPMNFSGQTDNKVLELLKRQVEMIVSWIVQELQDYITTCYRNIRIMTSAMNVSLFPFLTPQLEQCTSMECLIVAMRGMAWNTGFFPIMEADDFHEAFLTLFDHVVQRFLETGWSPLDIDFETTPERIKTYSDNIHLLEDLIVLIYRVLVVLKQRFTGFRRIPFPCCSIAMINNQKSLGIIRQLFPFIFSACLHPVTHDLSERLHYFSLHSMSLWFECRPLQNRELLVNPRFLDQLARFAADVPSIILSLLKHHFVTLLPVWLTRSIQSDGSLFFRSICDFFRAPHPNQNSIVYEILEFQWKSSKFDDVDPEWSEFVNLIYAEGGNIIASCFLYLAMPEKELREAAFILLASIVPLLAVFHEEKQCDDLNQLLWMFVQYSSVPLTISIVSDIATQLISTVSYCIEQILDRMIEAISNFSQEAERIIFGITPFIDSLALDLENRVVSNATDVQFIRFSCCSLIERLVAMLKPLDVHAEDSLRFSIWPSLASRRGL